MSIRIQTNPVFKQLMDSCYQEILCSVFAFHKAGPRAVIPGYWKTQTSLWALPDPDYHRQKKQLDEKSFNWAIALAGTANSDEKKMVNDYYEHSHIRYWHQIKKFIQRGMLIIRSLSTDDHLGLIRQFNPDFCPLTYRITCPAALELALRQFGPLMAGGEFAKDVDRPGEFRDELHSIMVTGIFNIDDFYCVEYKDGLSPELQHMEFSIFQKKLTNDSSAILHYDHKLNNIKFIVKGKRESGTLLRFQLSDEGKPESYFFKNKDEILPNILQYKGKLSIHPEEDFSDLEPNEGYVYTAIPAPYTIDDLDRLSLIFCHDPQDALKLLETECEHIYKPAQLSPINGKRKPDNDLEENEDYKRQMREAPSEDFEEPTAEPCV